MCAVTSRTELEIEMPTLSRFVVWRFGRASDEEALQMVLAYLRINDPKRRRELLDLAEKYASETAPVVQDNHDHDKK
ncbi:hypothetical protein [Tardiphaga sp.]|uniref:hypothetical protein n=1 Tax=Tardiphaga sp. TaxID=1926292 RepID=UPI00260B79A2|nr:hypothetical protein [Tardiphaga sp.]